MAGIQKINKTMSYFFKQITTINKTLESKKREDQTKENGDESEDHC